MTKLVCATLFLCHCSCFLLAQHDSIPSRFSFETDFRFRIEHDWDSRRPDGNYRADRTRMRYRVRAGATYALNSWASMGIRLRTGDPVKQQDPQLTLGDGFREFATLPVGLDKAYFSASWPAFTFWVGKNTFPFKKSNELFWSDNVNPDGLFVKKSFAFNAGQLNKLDLGAGHFILNTSGRSLDSDSYMQGFQVATSWFDQRFDLFPSMYLFRNMADIPDGNGTYTYDLSIFHIGGSVELAQQPRVRLETDYYRNFEDYGDNGSIPADLRDQKSGVVLGITYGALSQPQDWTFRFAFAYLEQFAAVDYFAQNDWVRWDYSGAGSPDGRLTNFRGIELVGGYMPAERMHLKMKYYLVEQIVPYGIFTETGSRLRLDLDVQF